jgi:hypothetical protein
MRAAVEALVGGELSDKSWKQAQLNIISGGLGLRDVGRHAAAAYVASLWSCRRLCQQIDKNFDLEGVGDGGFFQEALVELRGACLEAANLNLPEVPVSQKHLSALVDGALKAELRFECRAEGAHLAHLSLVALPCAGVWLTSHPAEDGRNMEPDLFKIAVKRQLRAKVLLSDTYCPCCGDLMDCFGDHALVCRCKGDRTVRHNHLRNLVFEEAVLAGTGAEKEKPGLLPVRPEADGLHVGQGDRRPADVWIPRSQGGAGEALDFACTSGMRADILDKTRVDGSVVFPLYEELKRSYKGTDQLCREAGFKFTPLVFEAHGGGWSVSARKVLDTLAKSQSVAWQTGQEPASLRIAQRISISLHRENARAVLRRLAPPLAQAFPEGWDGVDEEEVEME